MRVMKALPFVMSLLAVMTIGCASTYFKSRFEPYGQYGKFPSFVENQSEPELFIGTAPNGVTLSGGNVTVDTVDWTILGRIDVFRNFERWDLGFIEYNEDWRRAYCPGIVILTYASLFTLAITPIPWPCVYEKWNSERRIEERKGNAIKRMFEKANEIGATHLVYAAYTDRSDRVGSATIIPVGNSAIAVGSSSDKKTLCTGMTAIALRQKGRSPAR